MGLYYAPSLPLEPSATAVGLETVDELSKAPTVINLFADANLGLSLGLADSVTERLANSSPDRRQRQQQQAMNTEQGQHVWVRYCSAKGYRRRDDECTALANMPRPHTFKRLPNRFRAHHPVRPKRRGTFNRNRILKVLRLLPTFRTRTQSVPRNSTSSRRLSRNTNMPGLLGVLVSVPVTPGLPLGTRRPLAYLAR